MWASKSAHGYISHMEGICHLLEATIDEPWTDPFALSLRYHLIIPAASVSKLRRATTPHR